MVWEHDRAGEAPLDDRRYRRITELLAAAGLQVCQPLIQPHIGPASEPEQAGFDVMVRLWSSDEKPDGLIVLDDILCRGVLRATLTLGVDLPRDLKLVSTSNRGIGFPYHKPVTRVEFDTAQLAEHAVQRMIQLSGWRSADTLAPIAIKGKLIEGETT